MAMVFSIYTRIYTFTHPEPILAGRSLGVVNAQELIKLATRPCARAGAAPQCTQLSQIYDRRTGLHTLVGHDGEQENCGEK